MSDISIEYKSKIGLATICKHLDVDLTHILQLADLGLISTLSILSHCLIQIFSVFAGLTHFLVNSRCVFIKETLASSLLLLLLHQHMQFLIEIYRLLPLPLPLPQRRLLLQRLLQSPNSLGQFACLREMRLGFLKFPQLGLRLCHSSVTVQQQLLMAWSFLLALGESLEVIPLCCGRHASFEVYPRNVRVQRRTIHVRMQGVDLYRMGKGVHRGLLQIKPRVCRPQIIVNLRSLRRSQVLRRAMLGNNGAIHLYRLLVVSQMKFTIRYSHQQFLTGLPLLLQDSQCIQSLTILSKRIQSHCRFYRRYIFGARCQRVVIGDIR